MMNKERCIEISSLLDTSSLESSNFELVKPSRKFILEGRLGYISHHYGFQERFIFLFSDLILICKGSYEKWDLIKQYNESFDFQKMKSLEDLEEKEQRNGNSSSFCLSSPRLLTSEGGIEDKERRQQLFQGKKLFKVSSCIPLLSEPLIWAFDYPDNFVVRNCFFLVTETKTFVFFARTPREKANWLRTLNETISHLAIQVPALKNCQFAHAKKLLNLQITNSLVDPRSVVANLQRKEFSKLLIPSSSFFQVFETNVYISAQENLKNKEKKQEIFSTDENMGIIAFPNAFCEESDVYGENSSKLSIPLVKIPNFSSNSSNSPGNLKKTQKFDRKDTKSMFFAQSKTLNSKERKQFLLEKQKFQASANPKIEEKRLSVKESHKETNSEDKKKRKSIFQIFFGKTSSTKPIKSRTHSKGGEDSENLSYLSDSDDEYFPPKMQFPKLLVEMSQRLTSFKQHLISIEKQKENDGKFKEFVDQVSGKYPCIVINPLFDSPNSKFFIQNQQKEDDERVEEGEEEENKKKIEDLLEENKEIEKEEKRKSKIY